jgi:hypothetical protein
MKPMKPITIVVTTSRPIPRLDWIIDSFKGNCPEIPVEEVIVVSLYDSLMDPVPPLNHFNVRIVAPKPNPWQGKHRQTPVDWWAKANSINTALCLVRTEWVLFLDDRLVVQPGFGVGLQAAYQGNYIMAGGYEKRTAVTVSCGAILNGGIIVGKDGREGAPFRCGGEWLFGCVVFAKLEWWLDINGSPEKCNGLGFEDVITGFLFSNAGRMIKYDSRSSVIEDRSPDEFGVVMRRESKERHAHDTSDKAHTLLNWARGADKPRKSENGFNLRELRDAIGRGDQFPTPPLVAMDWFDNQLLKDMK